MGRGRKEGEMTSMEAGYLYSGKEANSWPNDQAEHERDQSGFIFKGRFLEAKREMLVRRDVLCNL